MDMHRQKCNLAAVFTISPMTILFKTFKKHLCWYHIKGTHAGAMYEAPVTVSLKQYLSQCRHKAPILVPHKKQPVPSVKWLIFGRIFSL